MKTGMQVSMDSIQRHQQQSSEWLSVALAHLSMIAQAANGEYRPRPGEIEERQAWLTEYLLTGKGIVSDSGKLSAQIVNNALKLSTQSVV